MLYGPRVRGILASINRTSCLCTCGSTVIWEPLRLGEPIPPPSVLIIVPDIGLIEARNSGLGIF
jgi:hypothetical protein